MTDFSERTEEGRKDYDRETSRGERGASTTWRGGTGGRDFLAAAAPSRDGS